MKINRIELKNFKKYESFELDLHPQFTLLVGENGSGKTTILDALAVAAGIWLVDIPDSSLLNSKRKILSSEIRLVPERIGDRVLFSEKLPVEIIAEGSLTENNFVRWTRQIRQGGTRTTNADADEALKIIAEIYKKETAGERTLCPILAYYGAGRAWLASNDRKEGAKLKGVSRRWAAFYDCFNERIRVSELENWFIVEAIAKAENGKWRPGFEAVRYAILKCVPFTDDIWFDGDRGTIVVSIDNNVQPFDNLSAGQRMMVAMVADLAIKAVMQNAFLIPPTSEENPNEEGLPRVLAETPGLVLIDELDVHLHPAWQRIIATCLKSTFPKIQFVCTSHSPQVIGEVQPDEIRLLNDNGYTTPSQAYGMDSNRVLEEIMYAPARNAQTDEMLANLSTLIDQDKFTEAKNLIQQLGSTMHDPDDPELTHARSLISLLESTKCEAFEKD